MGRRGNPYDNAKAESFMKTLKVEAVYLMAYETFEDVTADLPRFFGMGLTRRSCPSSWLGSLLVLARILSTKLTRFSCLEAGAI